MSEAGWKIEAVIERPYARIMNMHALLIERGGVQEIAGMSKHAEQPLSDADIYSLFGRNIGDYALKLAEVEVPDYLNDVSRGYWAALSVGRDYQARSTTLGLPIREIRHEEPVETEHSHLWFDSTQRIFQHMKDRQEELFKAAIATRDDKVSTLLWNTTGGIDLRTAAALMHTAEDDDAREQTVRAFWRILVRDNHFYDYDLDNFTKKLQDIINETKQ